MKEAEMYRLRDAMEEKEQLAEKIAMLECARISPRVAAYEGEPVHSTVKKDINAETLVKIEELLQKYNEKLSCILDLQARFEEAAQCLLERERRIMRRYFLDGLTWEKIASDENIGWTQIMRLRRDCIARMSNVKN